MIALYLLAAHLVGDFVLQNRWQAADKFADRTVRAQHVGGYLVPFVPLATIYGRSAWQSATFIVVLGLLHFATDSRRFRSTLGDVLQWRLDYRRDEAMVKRSWLTFLVTEHMELGLGHSAQSFDINDSVAKRPTPNPWQPIGLCIDQTLHICQLALVGGLLL